MKVEYRSGNESYILLRLEVWEPMSPPFQTPISSQLPTWLRYAIKLIVDLINKQKLFRSVGRLKSCELAQRRHR